MSPRSCLRRGLTREREIAVRLGPQQLLVPFGDISPAAVACCRKRRQSRCRTARREVLRECLSDDGSDGPAFASGVKLQIALERFGHENGRPFHMMYDSIPSRLRASGFAPWASHAVTLPSRPRRVGLSRRNARMRTYAAAAYGCRAYPVAQSLKSKACSLKPGAYSPEHRDGSVTA